MSQIMKTSSLGALQSLIMSVHQDLVAQCAPGALRSRAYKRDRMFLASASDAELLMGLPVVGKAFDRSLCSAQERSFTYADCASLAPVPDSRFSYFLDGVHDGRAECVAAFRQLHLLYAKYEQQSSDLVDEAINAFVARQLELPETVTKSRTVVFARDLVGRVLSGLDWTEIIPRHGPGALATGEKPWEKFAFRRIYQDMQDCYPADQYFFANVHHLSESISTDGLLCEGHPWEELTHSHCKLVAVPKDYRGPRIIAMEALEKQWIQQGQRRVLVRRMEHHPLTRGYVNFASQEVNRGLALQASINGGNATIDLKDASDRVSFALCSALIEEPAISYLRASRSVGVELPSKQIIRLRSFSPMGSAVCFPIESLIFYALCMSAALQASKPTLRYPSFSDWYGLRGVVWVYGDDIVVNSRFVEPVFDALSSVGLVVNKDKCCVAGRFRESCGCDAYNGRVITPVRVKHLPCRHNPSSFPSACSYLNEFKRRGMMNSFNTLLMLVEQEFGTVPYLTCHNDPCGITTTSFTEAVVWNNAHFRARWNSTLQETEWLVTSVSPKVLKLAIPGWSQYLRALTHGFTVGQAGVTEETGWSIPHALIRNQRWRTL